MHHLAKLLPLAAAGALTLSLSACGKPSRPGGRAGGELRANHVVWVADDFVINVWHNGRRVPDNRRELLEERFGATVERAEIEVRAGDWLVFNLANNRMRWGGAYYFALSGGIGEGDIALVSELESGDWTSCDNPSDVAEFIAEPDSKVDRRALRVTNPWGDGGGLMRKYAGKQWNGKPVWGKERNTWVKVWVR